MKIGLIGTFDVNNFGDCMFPELYSNLLLKSFPEADITLFSPTDNAASILSFGILKALPSRLSDVSILDSEYFILIGGETIGFGHSSGTFNFKSDTLSAYLRLWLTPIFAAKFSGKTDRFFAVHCVGAIKMQPTINRLIAQALGAVERVRFRDKFSCAWIKSESTEFLQDVDPMFLLDELLSDDEWSRIATPLLPRGVEKNGYLVAQMSIGYGADNLDAWVGSLAELHRHTVLPILFLPICHFLKDSQLLEEARCMLSARGVPCFIIPELVNVKATAAIIGNSAGYIGTSLHGAVTAVAFGRPLAVLGHSMDGKHEGTLQSVGLPGLVCTDPLELPGCFLKSQTMDQSAARRHAHSLAKLSFEALVDAMRSPRSISANELLIAREAIDSLVKLEVEQASVISLKEMKRLVLRLIRSNSVTYVFYERFRMWKFFRKIKS
jgi:polysaccharide pyruvyl transferase WcaK-like protein